MLGTYDAASGAPPARLVEELHRTERYEVRQRWQPGGTANSVEDGEADWILHVDAAAVLPTRFVDDFLGVVSTLSELGVERAQPAHMAGPDAGPPVTEQLRGVLGRDLETTTPLPVTAVRSGAEREGPTALVDTVPIALAGPIGSEGDPLGYSNVRDVFIADGDGLRRGVQRTTDVADAPRISVLLATYERPALLAACLEGFCDQTLAASEFEVVVVDDGSAGLETERVLTEFADRLPLTWARIDHSGRAAAKNLAVLLARGDLVLFFDDDDRPAPDLLDQHVRAHAQHPGTATAILGHTGWDPQLEVSPRDALPHRGRPAALLLWRLRARRGDRLAGLLGGPRVGEALAPPASRAARSAPRVLDRRGARVAAARPGPRGRLPPRRPQFHVTVDRRRRVQPSLRGKGARPGGHRIPSRRCGDPRVHQGRGRLRTLGGRAARAAAAESAHPGARGDGGRRRWNGAALAELHGCYREVFFAHNAKGVADMLGDVAPIADTPRAAAPRR